VLAARKTYLITARAHKTKRTARLLAKTIRYPFSVKFKQDFPHGESMTEMHFCRRELKTFDGKYDSLNFIQIEGGYWYALI